MFPNCKRILCIEDNEDAGEMMQILLAQWNYESKLAFTGQAGLALAQRERFDVYLLDMHLPDISGIELCQQLCALPRHAPVVFLTADAYPIEHQRGLQAGAQAYLTKPLDFELLEKTLAQCCGPAVRHAPPRSTSPFVAAPV